MRGDGMTEGKRGRENFETLGGNLTSAGAMSGPCLGAKAGKLPLLHRPETSPGCFPPSSGNSYHLLSTRR